MTAPTSKYVCAPESATSATSDHAQAATVPSEISVSMVAAPCRAFRSAARWNPAPAPNTTGVASTRPSHSQPENCSAGSIAINASGSDNTTATISRIRARRASSAWLSRVASGSEAW